MAIVNAEGDVVKWACRLRRHALERLSESAPDSGETEFYLELPWESVILEQTEGGCNPFDMADYRE
jgi:hypothetical protein